MPANANRGLEEEAPSVDQPIPAGGKLTFQDKEIDEHPELVNLAKFMDPNELQMLGQQCFEEFKEDEESRSDWMKMQAEWIELYHGKLKPKEPPWDGASDDHLPVLAEGCVQFHARAYKAFFATQSFVSAIATGSVQGDDKARADRVGKYMSWQLGVKDKSFKKRKDRLLKALPLHGSYFTKTYRDNLNRKLAVENVSPLDFVANYSCVGVDVDELERKTQIIYLPPRLGRYYGSEVTQNYFISPPAEAAYQKDLAREKIEKATGISDPVKYTGGRPAKILEQHRWLDLDGDGIEEPYVVWIDASDQSVKRIAIRWSWEDWVRSQSKDPLEYFTHYEYITNPDGFYAFGQGHLVGGANIAIDKILRQIVDAGTLQNARPGFATQQAAMKSGDIRVQPGRIKKLNASGKINEMIAWMDHPGPSEALWRILSLLTSRADRLNMVTDMLTGQSDKVWQSQATHDLIEQGLMTFSAVQIRVHSSLEQELQKIFRLNGMFLQDEEYFLFNDGQSEQEYTVFRTDFKSELQVRPAFDPHQLTEKEKKQSAMIEYEAAMKNPLIMRSVPHMIAVTRRFFLGMGSTDVAEIVPDAKSLMQQQSQAQEMQKEAMQREQAREDASVKTDVMAGQVDAAAEQAKIRQKDRELDLKAADLKLKAGIAQANESLETTRVATEVITALREKGESDD